MRAQLHDVTDPFEVFGVPRRYDVDLAEIGRVHRELSRALHPDRFAGAGASERRRSLERATEVNHAFRVLEDPVRRAEAMFELAGVPVGEASEPKASPAFLMEVLEEREAVGEARAARDVRTLERIEHETRARARAVQAALGAGFSRGGDLASLLPLLGQLRFYLRMLEELEAVKAEWEDA